MVASFVRRTGAFLLIGCALTGSAFAGMTMPVFTEIAKTRFQVLSFFLLLYLLVALAYQWIWNSLRKDFPKLPLLRFRGALGVVAVCGLFIYVVLTMISGARELMTPGAWARSGVAYRLRDPEKDPKPWIEAARRASMERLRVFLWKYAGEHGGSFPRSRDEVDLPQDAWNSIDPGGLLMGYMPGLRPDAGNDVLAWEPASFGATRFALLSNGEIVQLPTEELVQRVEKRLKESFAADSKKAAHE